MADQANNEWKECREQEQAEKQQRRTLNTADILDLDEFGYQVDEINEYQFRITHPDKPGYRGDLYPTNQKFHILKPEKRGRYSDAVEFINRQFKP